MASFRGVSGFLKSRAERRCPQLNDFQLGYWAALLDGEGSIWRDKKWSRGRYFIQISNTNLELLKKALEMVGGCGSVSNPKVNARGRKPIYRIDIFRATDVEALLRQLLPFLVEKRAKAEEVLGLMALNQAHRERYLQDLEETKYLYIEQGLSLNEVGQRLGITADTVWSRLNKLGIPRRPALRRPNVYA